MAGNQVMNLAEQKPKEQTTDSSVPAWFSTTHWSEVMLAGGSGSPEAAAALEKLCRGYWLPLYSYVRKKGYSPADAKDLTQGFFLRLLRMESLAEVNLTKGKFRTFLLASLNNFLSDERDHAWPRSVVADAPSCRSTKPLRNRNTCNGAVEGFLLKRFMKSGGR